MFFCAAVLYAIVSASLEYSAAEDQQSFGTIDKPALADQFPYEPFTVERGTTAFFLHVVNHGRNHQNVHAEYKQISPISKTAHRDVPATNNSEPPQTHFQPVGEQDIADRCIKVPNCDRNAKYRSINGSCNNLVFPMWGFAGTALVRLVPAVYEDGVKKPRRSKNRLPLPNVRDLRTSLFPEKKVPDNLQMLIIMEWGQIVSHDTSHIITEVADDDKGPLCCTRRGRMLPPILLPQSCLPIRIPLTDEFYSQFRQTCLNFIRATTTTDMGCVLSPEQQVVSVTHFVDASFVYGSFDSTARELREFSGGRLRAKITSDDRMFLPNVPKPTEKCDVKSDDDVCYFAGDDRVNLNNDLTAIQVILLREHNRLCSELHKLNPHWDDETLYQEARRIVAAIVQRITYRHYLPILIGEDQMKMMDLMDGDGDDDLQVGKYNEFLNPSTVNGFTTAAYRSFHSMITGGVLLVHENTTIQEELDFSDFYLKPGIVEQPHMLDNFLRGLRLQAAESMDVFDTHEITNLLLKSNKKFGSDLVSIDIQRGRDHGLAPYNEYRFACGLKRAESFADLIDVMSESSIKQLESKYTHVDDIDLLVGAMMETLIPGTLFGPTFQCLVSEQFKRWRDGDRYYYDFGGLPGSFTKKQVVEIRKVTLSTIFCQNGDNISTVQKNIFLKTSDSNPELPCKQLPKMDLSPWKE